MTTRAITASERSALEEEIAKARQRFSERNGMLFGPAFTLVLVLVGLGALIRWGARMFFDYDLGLQSAATPWLLSAGVVFFALAIGSEVVKTFRRSRAVLGPLVADLSSETVEEKTLNIVDAMRFQEPEHGGFLYFLRTSDERVYVQFDYESQDLGVDGQDPMLSKYSPRTVLKIIRAPQSGHILASDFSGDPVRISQTKKLKAKPRKWPEPDTFCKIPWSRLASAYAA
jgi:hypothetical protein